MANKKKKLTKRIVLKLASEYGMRTEVEAEIDRLIGEGFKLQDACEKAMKMYDVYFD